MLKPTALLLVLLLPACGMKGDLYEPAPPAEPAVESPAEPADVDRGERKTIPARPDPARSQ